ncbi:DUF2867 domain-containing protein [Pseudoduganella buxea]|uniref:DUF2867 domain-containing protein n=1 Tax=Pseudoduganella buxea TaxID=1949069 RepID=A0A6I3T6I2_9BURK|nr:DUF2867 domain-containing protein [Pseudoduganella buxea]MTV56356.1 DUF2867 domain-containing protein [Pseudoduganella buxea]GGC25607.1 hypothetical protein GCM10011572_53730 [Pseudoduganella buxea]
MPNELTAAVAVSLPSHSGVARMYQSVHLADAFAIRLPAGATHDPEVLARFIFSNQPAWVATLMRVRDSIVAHFGLKTGAVLAVLADAHKAERVGIFRIYSSTPAEIVVGEDDRHLDFRLSVLCQGTPDTDSLLTLSTVVHCHNRLGRTYILLIAPFHRLVVKASLRRAARIGWPRAGAPVTV